MPFRWGRRLFRNVCTLHFNPVSFTFWMMKESASAFRMRDLWEYCKTHTRTQTKSGSSCYQHATDDICRCWNSKALYTEDICPFPHRRGKTPPSSALVNVTRPSPKTTSSSEADLTIWDPSNNICIRTSRLRNLKSIWTTIFDFTTQ